MARGVAVPAPERWGWVMVKAVGLLTAVAAQGRGGAGGRASSRPGASASRWSGGGWTRRGGGVG
jgi:hypothetical protein